MPHAQCKTYKPRNECTKYTIQKKSIFSFVWVKILLRKPHIQKEKTYSISRRKIETYQKRKILEAQRRIPKAQRNILELEWNIKKEKKINIEKKLT
jgi:hypothetical protein